MCICLIKKLEDALDLWRPVVLLRVANVSTLRAGRRCAESTHFSGAFSVDAFSTRTGLAHRPAPAVAAASAGAVLCLWLCDRPLQCQPGPAAAAACKQQRQRRRPNSHSWAEALLQARPNDSTATVRSGSQSVSSLAPQLPGPLAELAPARPVGFARSQLGPGALPARAAFPPNCSRRRSSPKGPSSALANGAPGRAPRAHEPAAGQKYAAWRGPRWNPQREFRPPLGPGWRIRRPAVDVAPAHLVSRPRQALQSAAPTNECPISLRPNAATAASGHFHRLEQRPHV